MRKIYIASSWKNSKQVSELAKELREIGHQVFDFTDVDNRPEGLGNFVFDGNAFAKYHSGKTMAEVDWIEFLSWEPTKRAFASDKKGIDWSDTLIILNPSGRSSHLEAGYAVGKGKDVFIFGDLPLGEFDAMYLFADGWYKSADKDHLFNHLKAEKKPKSHLGHFEIYSTMNEGNAPLAPWSMEIKLDGKIMRFVQSVIVEANVEPPIVKLTIIPQKLSLGLKNIEYEISEDAK